MCRWSGHYVTSKSIGHCPGAFVLYIKEERDLARHSGIKDLVLDFPAAAARGSGWC
jgi:hypothetical protein